MCARGVVSVLQEDRQLGSGRQGHFSPQRPNSTNQFNSPVNIFHSGSINFFRLRPRGMNQLNVPLSRIVPQFRGDKGHKRMQDD